MNVDTFFPGHPFDGTSGIKLNKKNVEIYSDGDVIATGRRPNGNENVWEFWYNLEFANIFPLASWYFGSPWTGRVRVSSAQDFAEDGDITGYIQFVDEEQDGNLWFISHPYVNVPWPPLGVPDTRNLPLKMALCRLVYAVDQDTANPDEWYTVTSLVDRDGLSSAFPEMWLEPWQPEGLPGMAGFVVNMRDAFCVALGLSRNETEALPSP